VHMVAPRPAAKPRSKRTKADDTVRTLRLYHFRYFDEGG
jgi:hypothetical protein